jgi:predicted MPP superfamily phosphohydrolase
VFLLIAFLLLLGTSSFTAATLSYFTGLSAVATQLVAMSVAAIFVLVIFVSFRRQHPVLGLIGTVSAVVMGFFNFAFIAAIACWLILLILKISGITAPLAEIAWALFAAGGVATMFGLINAARLRVTRYIVRLPNLPESWVGKDVAMVSDIHIGNIRGASFARRIVARLQQLAPEAVFLTGDMFDGAKVDIAGSIAPWTKFHPPAGVYFVTGNHDEFSDRAPYLAELTKAGVRVLHNEKVMVNGLQVVGVHDAETHRPAMFHQLLQHAGINRNAPSILLAHQPRHLEIPEREGISLQLSGHTHGGQFWPWTLLVRRIYGPFAYGLNRRGSLQVVTSSGAGSWGPPMRVGTRSEIVLLTLQRTN